MKRRFYWDDWNREHITKHSVSIAEAEFVVAAFQAAVPQEIGGREVGCLGTDGRESASPSAVCGTGGGRFGF